MLPSLGLFKSIPCPLFPKCQRNPCMYSHSIQRPSIAKDRPVETIKRQKLNEPKKEIPVKRNEPFIPSLVSSSVESSKKQKSISKVESVTNSILSTLPKPKPTKKVTVPSGISALEARKRVAHTATFQAKPTGPPTILPSMKANIPLNVRQLTAKKLYESFHRIYEPILNQVPTLATDHAKEQEEKILLATTNLAGYKQQAATTLMHLKKRPVSTHKDDVGLDGEWVDPAQQKEAMSWLAKVKDCIVDLNILEQLNYPLPNVLSVDSEIIEMEGAIHKCDRCHQEYRIKSVLEKEDLDACTYHPLRMIFVRVDGIKQKVYGCCEDPIGSMGCKRGPHVYKDEDTKLLHQKIPFIQSPPPPSPPSSTKRNALVALDCEMGYTTAGMELIRLTAVNEKMEVLLDELVLPSHMIIDLNTQYSGIKTLEGVKYDLNGLRKELFKHIDQDTILLGHGLENDMNALRIIHTNIIDTVALFPHKNGLPLRNSLKRLASEHLKKFIQTGSDGHDSLEDARTCVELLEFYIKKVLDNKKT